VLVPRLQSYIGGEELGSCSHVMHGYITTVTNKQVTSQQNWMSPECKYTWIALHALLNTSIGRQLGPKISNYHKLIQPTWNTGKG